MWKWRRLIHEIPQASVSFFQPAQRSHLQNDWHHCILFGLVYLCSRNLDWTIHIVHRNANVPTQTMKMAKCIKIQGHDSSLSLKFSSILGLCDPILPRLCRSRTLYFEISNELSEHIWNHKGKFLCDESFQLNSFHVFTTAVKLIHIASRHLSTVMDG